MIMGRKFTRIEADADGKTKEQLTAKNAKTW